MQNHDFSRRQFIRTSAGLAGAAFLAPLVPAPVARAQAKRTAVDQVTLGKTGVKLSRLGFGTGVNNGDDQVKVGKEDFIKLIHYAYDQGITYFDCAGRYQTFGWMGEAIKGLPREKLYIQSKIWPQEGMNVSETIDMHRKNFNVDYIDTLLVHCRTEGDWTDRYKSMLDTYREAQSKKWIRARGVSCHSIPALELAAKSDWPEMHLVRCNPQGKYMDGPNGGWGDNVPPNPVEPVTDQIKIMHDKGRGVIGMKICGNGSFRNPEDRERSIRSAMANPNIDAIVIGFTRKEEIDEAIQRMNSALAA